MEIQPISQERLNGGSKQGKASVTCSPDSGGMHSRSAVIDTALPLRYFSVYPKRPFKIPIHGGWLRREKALGEASKTGKLNSLPEIALNPRLPEPTRRR